MLVIHTSLVRQSYSYVHCAYYYLYICGPCKFRCHDLCYPSPSVIATYIFVKMKNGGKLMINELKEKYNLLYTSA